MALVLPMLAAAVVSGDVTFHANVVIASGQDVSGAHVKIDAYDVGRVDLAWRDANGYARYSNFSAGVITIDGEGGLPLADHIMGVSRDGDTVRAGLNSSQDAQEYTRTGQASWILSDTSHNINSLAAPSGGYDVDPCTGLGGFIFKEDASNDIVYVHETTPNAWSKTVLETNIVDSAYGRYGDLVYSATGSPIGAYKTYDAGAALRAGAMTGSGPLSHVGGAVADQHLALTLAPDGTVYLVDDFDINYTLLHKSEDGTAWSFVSIVQDSLGSGSNGNDMDVAVAVAPDELRMAVLTFDNSLDATHPLALVTSHDGGIAWDTQMLHGGARGIADLGFDPAGNLYVAYYSDIEDALHLLMGTVGPTCKATSVEPIHNDQRAYSDMVLSWTLCAAATNGDVYFGTDYVQVLNASHADVGTAVADIDGSGRVDLGDVVVLADQWAGSPADFETPADVTGDDFVDVDDLHVLVRAWLATEPGVYRGVATNATYDAGPGQQQMTYYWRIDGVNDPCVYTGDVWSFKVDELVVFPEDYGAAGDGVTDDTDAFYAAAQAIENNDGGVLRLMPGKTYCIGKQVHTPGEYPYYQPQPMITIENGQRRVVVDGQGSTLKTNDGLHFATFDKDTGEPYYPDMPFLDFDYRADIGAMIYIAHSARVEIRDLTLDGNMDNLVLGGYWGDTGRQVYAAGIHLSSNDSATVKDVVSSHHGLDGMIISDPGALATDPCTPVDLYKVECCYNARQGLSWVGGVAVKAESCKFAHTGKGRFASAPGAGVDIEAEGAVNREGRFINCDFVNNTGGGLIADSGDSANCTFTGCLFWGTTNWSLWPRKPGFKFYDCDIYGTMVNVYGSSNPNEATQFYNCRFEDYEGQYDGVPLGVRRSAGLFEGHGENVRFDTCTFTANTIRALYIDTTTDAEIMTNCTVHHNYDGIGDHDFQSLLRGVAIDNTHFYETLPGPELYYIAAQETCIGPNVVVDGPKCKWGTWSAGGLTGAIPQGGCD